MIEVVLDVLRVLVWFVSYLIGWVIIYYVVSCVYRCFNYVFGEEDDDGNHPTHPSLSLHGGIEAAGIMNPSILMSIHIVLFTSCDFEDNVECVVCLSDLVDGDKTRVLSCNHLFHADCIEAWLQAHATCAICRKRVDQDIQNDHELRLSTSADSGEAHDDMTAEVVIDMPAEPDHIKEF